MDKVHHYIQTNGIRLHVVEAGSENKPLVVLLHGFPEFWQGWHHQIPALVEAGFRVWVPDQRGYNLSEKPKGFAAYNLDILAADIIGLLDAAGEEKAIIVGHDWGAAVAWWVAVKYPERVSGLTILNVAHPAVMKQYLLKSWKQRLRSWYMFYFQVPFLPEMGLRTFNFYTLATMLKSSSRAGTFTNERLEMYRQAWQQPGAVTGMLNWYRALLRTQTEPLTDIRIRVPTQVIWGAKDAFLGLEMAQPSVDMCEDGRLIIIDEATHWVQHEEPERVNRLLIDFFTIEDR